jgi:DNA polymerase I-like protein with 3'-5' exonuclease and polymerase domains
LFEVLSCFVLFRFSQRTFFGSRDWNVTLAEAQDTVERWYADRPEVRQWQQYTIENARQKGYTRTLMGRYRELPGISPSQVCIVYLVSGV